MTNGFIPARAKRLAAGGLTALFLFSATARAEPPRSIFYIDGLAVDTLDEGQDASARTKDASILKLQALPSRAPRKDLLIQQQRLRMRQLLSAMDLYLRQGKTEKAQKIFEKLYRLAPNELRVWERGAIVCSLTGQYPLAQQFYRKILDKQPNRLSFMTGYAAILIRMNRLEEAARWLDKVLQQEPGNLLAAFNRLLLDVARNRKTISDLEWRFLTPDQTELVANWLEADREQLLPILGPERYNRLASLALGQGTGQNLERLVKAFRAIRRPEIVNDPDKLLAGLRDLRAMGIDKVAMDVRIARLLLSSGRGEEAEALLRKLTVRYPEQWPVWYNHGYVLTRLGRYNEALAVLDKARSLNPDFPDISFARACVLAGAGKMDQAWPILQRLAREYPQKMPEWMEGDRPYLRLIRQDPRYSKLLPTRKQKPGSEDAGLRSRGEAE